MNTASCRMEIERLLKQSCDVKCLRGGSELALGQLDKAEALVKDLHELQGIWQAAIQYRKAHLFMRLAGSGEALSIRGWSEAHLMFLEASRHAPFSIRGRLYALVAGLKSGEYDFENPPTLMRDIFQSIGTPSDEMQTKCRIEPSRGALDSDLVNLIELTAYYWGTWNSALEGISQDPLFPNGKQSDAWLLLGNDRDLSRVRLDRRFAEAELDTMIDTGRVHLAFKESDHGVWMIKREDTSWENLNETAFMPLLASLLTRHKGSLHQQLAAHPERTDPANLRQRKLRLKRFLAEKTGLDTQDIFQSDPSGDSLNPELKIFGVARETTVYPAR